MNAPDKKMIRVRPQEGGRVYHPVTRQPIAAAGELLEQTPQILRYLRRGDLELVERAPEEPKHKPSQKAGK